MDKEKLFEFYNQSQEYFDLTEKGHLEKTIFPIHQEILNKCKKKRGLIVDLGCGTGLDISKMAGGNNHCLGIDVSQIAVNRAKTRKINHAHFLKSNLENLPLDKKSANVITSFFTFEHLFNSEKVLLEADRILKKSGELFILCPNFASPFRGAPVYGWYSKDKIFKKMLLSLRRMFNVWILRKKDFKVKMIDESLIDLNKIGEDWDAVNEPSMFEFVNYFKRKNYQVDFKTWLSPPKTKGEKLFSYLKNFPIVKYWGPICYLYAKKR